jgi:hypothetical protein
VPLTFAWNDGISALSRIMGSSCFIHHFTDD